MTCHLSCGNRPCTAAYFIGIRTGSNRTAAVGNGNIRIAAACQCHYGTACTAYDTAAAAGCIVVVLTVECVLVMVDSGNFLACEVSAALCTDHNAVLIL